MIKYIIFVVLFFTGCGKETSSSTETIDISQNSKLQKKCVDERECKSICKERHPVEVIQTACPACTGTTHTYRGDYEGYQSCLESTIENAKAWKY